MANKKIAQELPYNELAEMAVIGGAFLSKDSCLDVVNSLNEDDFFLGKHQLIFRAIQSLNKSNKAVDVLTVTEELLNYKELENIGGVDYLQKCCDQLVAISSLEFYIQIVQHQSVLRKLLLEIRHIDDRYHNEEIEDVDDFITQAKVGIDKVLEKRRISSFVTTAAIVPEVKAKIEALSGKENNDGIIGLTTGYDGINRFTSGFKKGEVIIVAARPNVGKTALCMNFAYRAATFTDKAVAIFSLEMSRDLLLQRLLGISSCVPLNHISNGMLTNAEKAKLSTAMDELSEAKIFIDDTPGIRLTDIITKSKKLQANRPDLGLIIIDYLGLVQTTQTSRNADSRQEEVRKISLALKELARDLNIPIVVVSQLSRNVENRDSKKPMMSDLRDSGNIEQDADIIMLLYREDYYDRKENPANKKKGGQLSSQDKFDLAKEQKEKELGQAIPGNASYVEVNIAKNRNGGTGRTGLFFYKDYGRFEQPGPEWEALMAQVAKDFGTDD